MSRTISFKTTFALASVSVFAAFAPTYAQEESSGDGDSTAVEAEAGIASTKPTKVFRPLMRCVRAEGKVQLLRPRSNDWIDAVEGRYYPFGSRVRVEPVGLEKPNVEFEFGEGNKITGEKASVLVNDTAEFATREIKFGESARVVELARGRIRLSFPRTLGEGLLKVVAPAFCCENIAGESLFDYTKVDDGDEAVIRCVTGKFSLKGSHYAVPVMAAANQVRIRTTGDQLFSSIRGESGDCKVILDRGMEVEKNFETGEMKDVPKSLEFSLSPQCSIKIFRAKSAVGGRMSVSTMTFSPTGQMLNRFAFAEGLSGINSGELVIPDKIPDEEKSTKRDDDDDSETVDVAAPAKKEKDEDESDEEKKDEKKDEDI